MKMTSRSPGIVRATTMHFVETSDIEAARLKRNCVVEHDAASGALTIRTHNATRAELKAAVNAGTDEHGMRVE